MLFMYQCEWVYKLFWKDICKQLVTVGTSAEGLKNKVKGDYFHYSSLDHWDIFICSCVCVCVCVCVCTHIITTNENIIDY